MDPMYGTKHTLVTEEMEVTDNQNIITSVLSYKSPDSRFASLRACNTNKVISWKLLVKIYFLVMNNWLIYRFVFTELLIYIKCRLIKRRTQTQPVTEDDWLECDAAQSQNWPTFQSGETLKRR